MRLGRPKIRLGRPKMRLGRPKIRLGRPKMRLGRPKTGLDVLVERKMLGPCRDSSPGPFRPQPSNCT
jgi:hypothetical protein